MIAGEWVKVFRFFEGAISFKAGPVTLNDQDDPVAQAAFALARVLAAKVVGDDGEEYRIQPKRGR
jgi:hypothetical protein